MYRETKRERQSRKASNQYFKQKMLRLKKGKKQKTRWVTYKEYLLSDVWKRKREQKLKESGYKCEECNSKIFLQVHHKTYKHIFKEPMKDLKTLCEVCHKANHNLLTDEEIEIEVQGLMESERLKQ